MPIRFRCSHCQGLMAISSRKAGAIVNCPTCGEQTMVPMSDLISPTAPSSSSPTQKDDAGEASTDKSAQDPAREIKFATFSPSAPDPGAGVVDEDSSRADDVTEQHSLDRGRESDVTVPTDHEREDDAGEDGDEESGPLTFHRHTCQDDEMDLTPMVDVTFQLLIFFMVSASFSLQKSIEVPTPDPSQKGATQQVQTVEDVKGTSILVKIDATSTIWIDEDQLSDPGRLVDTLRDKMRREQKTELLVTAHPQSLHRTIISVIDAANEIGVQKIRMASQKKME